jgi:hypothetical protein
MKSRWSRLTIVPLIFISEPGVTWTRLWTLAAFWDEPPFCCALAETIKATLNNAGAINIDSFLITSSCSQKG